MTTTRLFGVNRASQIWEKYLNWCMSMSMVVPVSTQNSHQSL
jgi:hypothetical protein